jgi:hypothetical protein
MIDRLTSAKDYLCGKWSVGWSTNRQPKSSTYREIRSLLDDPYASGVGFVICNPLLDRRRRNVADWDSDGRMKKNPIRPFFGEEDSVILIKPQFAANRDRQRERTAWRNRDGRAHAEILHY